MCLQDPGTPWKLVKQTDCETNWGAGVQEASTQL